MQIKKLFLDVKKGKELYIFGVEYFGTILLGNFTVMEIIVRAGIILMPMCDVVFSMYKKNLSFSFWKERNFLNKQLNQP